MATTNIYEHDGGNFINPDVRMKSHEAANDYPLLEGDEKDAFKDDLRTKGIIDPITVWVNPKGEEVVIDGRNRYFNGLELVKEGALQPGTEDRFALPCQIFEGAESQVLTLIMTRNLQGRRHLSQGQRAALAVRSWVRDQKYRKREGQEADARPDNEVMEWLAKITGVSSRYLYHCKKIHAHSPKLLDSVIAGSENGLSIPLALKAVRQAAAGNAGTEGEAPVEDDADAGKVKDGNKEVVTDPRYLDTFKSREHAADIARAVRDLKSKLEIFGKGDGGAYLDVDEVKGWVNNIGKAVKAANPHAICPQCNGEKKVETTDGKRKKCQRCDGLGYVNLARYQGNPTVAAEESADAPEVRLADDGSESPNGHADDVPAAATA